MTEKLFYKNTYIKEFVAKGRGQRQDENGEWYVVLDATAFYPTGGGQPFDTGTLNGRKVVKVEEIDGEVRHYVEEKLANIEKVSGEIDWQRRFDHMQQHAGQHILTAAFEELFQIHTVSFHLGKEVSTIDLDQGQISEELFFEAERRANEIVLENRLIEAKWVSQSEAAQYKLRKELSVTENIRLVIIPGYDYNGCGGTHPSSTGEVGMIKILDWEKQRNKVRVHFICGDRIKTQLQQKHSILKELSQLLSASEKQLPIATEKLLDLNKSQAKVITDLQEQCIQLEAEQLMKSLKDWSGAKVIAKVFTNRSVQQLQRLAHIMIEHGQGVNVFFITENLDKIQFVFSRDKAAKINMKTLANEIFPLINGKGGGSESTVQGGGELKITGEEILSKLQNLLSSPKV